MGTNQARPATEPDVREAVRAYLDALALAEPLQSALWRSARLTLVQLNVLRALRDRGPLNAGRLGDMVGISPTSTTRLLDRLEGRGLVRRRAHPDDRRCVVIHLTPEGERVLGDVRVVSGTPLLQAVRSLDADDRRALTRTLRALVDRASAAARVESGCPGVTPATPAREAR